jgi:cholest-4-en-3-one 26-monooxygenase
VPQGDRSKIFDWSNKMAAYDDPEYAITAEVGAEAAMEIVSYAMNLAVARKECPAKDIVSQLVAAEDEGNLSSDEFGFFVILLAVAGNETTRNAITHGMHALLTHPDQWELFKRERPATTAEEIVRWATPVVSFQRTATQDTELGGAKIKAGDRVGIFYSSANNDPEVFDDPGTFDITRDPNPHLGFGGGGPHFCLGKSLAVLEINLIFDAVADAMPGLHLTGDPRRLRSAWLNGVKELRVSTG